MIFYELKGLILADARCLESFYSMIVFSVGLSQEGAYTSRCQMPDRMDENDYIGDGLYLGDHTKSFGSSDWYRDVGVRDGYVSIGEIGRASCRERV